ncbi:protein kinase [Anaeromyxobacter sp. SG17]|uniref:serine/threonine-protein kinase n=1 Tax=Anaeromyxobacter sp. SG17 TaxID=2925405 RepID=UPI001F567181|nr:protein kinase [Anaeromyxobacter sp. SG17]
MARRKPAPEPPVACARCGHLADPSRGSANFCTACGEPLRAGATGARGTGRRRGKDGVVADRYRLVELLGEGGMGRVYKAEHIRMGKTLALKLLREDFAREPTAAERFLAEARAVSRLSHPHTLAVFDFGEVGRQGGLYLAMEYVPGEDLAAALARSGPFPEARAREVGQQVLGSLAEAHDAGVVHRDVKPANVMLMRTRGGEDFVKVLDFGIASLRDDFAGGADAGAGAILGTPAYLAPEQARGSALDGRADLYALGCVLYELVAGRPPFVAPSPMAVVKAHLSQEPPPLASLAPGVSRAFADVVHRALAKRPQDRFPSADAMRAALLALAAPAGRARTTARELEGDLDLASREDFDALGRQVRALRAGRLAPLALAGSLAVLAAGAALAWRWDGAYALLAARAPSLAAALPGALRPDLPFDGREHEPNDRPEQANPLPLPAGPEGATELLGRVGERRGRELGDADVFRVEVPDAGPRTALEAEWTGADAGAGLPGLDVALTLHRAPDEAAGGEAPLVAQVDRGGPGGAERLVAAVSRGTYYLAVRERHAPGAPPVERPEHDYRLRVRLVEARPGEELEPDEPPAPGAAAAEWAVLAARNPLRPGAPLRGETSTDDPDVLAAEVAGAPALVALVPDPGVALEVRAPAHGPAAAASEALAEGLSAPGGSPLLVSLAPVPVPAAPVLLEVSALEDAGGYTALALGTDAASGEAALALVRALAGASRAAPALELAAAYAEELPRAAARDAVLLEAGRIAEAAAASLAPEGVAAYDAAARRLGEALFEAADGKVRYLAAFERRIGGAGPLAEEAALRAIALAPPCGAEEVWARAEAVLSRAPAPAPERAATARVLAARAAEELLRAAPADPALRVRAADAWRAVAVAVAGGPDSALSSARAAAIDAGELPPDAGPLCR